MPEARPAGDEIDYDRLFPARFAQPATYIRFSSTVEDCTGVSYCMDDVDLSFLTQLNAKHASQQSPRKRRGAGTQQDSTETRECSEEWFEQIMTSFEDTSQARQPFASVDHPPALTFDELVAAFDMEVVDEGAKAFAHEVYGHWTSRRATRGDQRLMPQLKTPRIDASGGQDADDNDPFVCFRRREFRQARKTRGRDAQIIDKLKRLRRELEDGRYLLDLVRKREISHKEDLQTSRDVSAHRHKLRRVKHESKITDDDEDLLINKPPPEARPPLAQPRQPPNLPPKNKVLEQEHTDMIKLDLKLSQRTQEINKQIQDSVLAHDKWNRSFIDSTESALNGVLTPSDMFLPEEERTAAQGRGFVGVKVEEKDIPRQQPTPPDSVVAGSPSERSMGGGEDRGMLSPEESEQTVQWASPSEYSSFRNRGRYRRRTGRGGRVMLDRHNLRTKNKGKIDDRFQFDRDSGDEEFESPLDLDSNEIMLLRMHLSGTGQPVRRTSAGANPRDIQMGNSHPTQLSQTVQQKQPST